MGASTGQSRSDRAMSRVDTKHLVRAKIDERKRVQSVSALQMYRSTTEGYVGRILPFLAEQAHTSTAQEGFIPLLPRCVFSGRNVPGQFRRSQSGVVVSSHQSAGIRRTPTRSCCVGELAHSVEYARHHAPRPRAQVDDPIELFLGQHPRHDSRTASLARTSLIRFASIFTGSRLDPPTTYFTCEPRSGPPGASSRSAVPVGSRTSVTSRGRQEC